MRVEKAMGVGQSKAASLGVKRPLALLRKSRLDAVPWLQRFVNDFGI